MKRGITLNKKSKNILTVLIIAVILGILIYFLSKGNLYGSIKNIFSSPQAFKKFVLDQGVWSPLVFLALQIAQVIVSPIPGNITSLAGGALFGGINACLLSMSAITIGSIIAFYLARIFGKPLVVKLIGEITFNKYNKILLGKGKLTLFLLFLLPFFPDDALCFLAGLSKLPLKLFLMYTIIGRLPGIIFTSFAGAGTVCLTVGGWIIVGVLSVIAIYVSIRYGEKIEEVLRSKIHFE